MSASLSLAKEKKEQAFQHKYLLGYYKDFRY